MKVLVTGSCGFIFSNFIIYALQDTKWDLVSIDKLTYAGSLYNISHNSTIYNKRHRFYLGDICDYHFVQRVFEIEKPDVVIHGAAESVREDTIIPYMGPKKIEHIEIKDLWNRFKKRNRVEICDNGTEVININSDQQRALTWKNGFGQWKKIKQISRHKYDGKMIHMRQKWGEIDVTPNHCIYNSNMDLVNPGPGQELLSVRSIARSHSEKNKCDRFGKYEWKTSIDDLLYMIAFYITKGCTTFNKANGSYITEFSQNNITDINRIKQIIESNFDLTTYICERKCSALRISNKSLFDTFRKECGYYSGGKVMPSFIFKLVPELQKKFVDYLVYFDGHKYTDTNKKFGTNSRVLAAQLSTILSMVKQDYSYSRIIFDNELWNDAYCFQLSGRYNSSNKCVYEEYHHNGWVYDLEIDDTHKFVCGLGNVVVHNSHVDNSIEHSHEFITTNVVGTHSMLEAALKVHTPEKFINISCYDDQTKAVTKDGLKSYNELKEGDVVFTLNPDSRVVEEAPVQRIITQDYRGKMIRMARPGVDILVTPNHRVYDENMRVCEASDVLQKNYIKFPRPAPFESDKNNPIFIDGKEQNLEDLFYIVGVYLGDGFTAYQEKHTTNKSGLNRKDFLKQCRDSSGRFVSKGKIGNKDTSLCKSYRIFFDIPENDKARKRTEDSLTNLGVSFTRPKGRSGEYIYFTSKGWMEFFEQLGCGAKNKKIPSWMLEYDYRYLKCLFDGLIDSDGCRSKGQCLAFTTTSETLKDGICELSSKIGLIPNANYSFSSSTKFEKRLIEGYAWNITFSKIRNKMVRSKDVGEVDYDGKIWCITVKNKNFLVERNGRYVFSGNTDEVYGSVEEGSSLETDRLDPRSPYSSSKASADLLGQSYYITHGLPVITTRCSNNFGPRQHIEKFIPKIITNILTDKKIPLYGDGKNMREWIYVKDNFWALKTIIEKGVPGEAYNISSGYEKTNVEVLDSLFEVAGRGRELVEYVKDRPGHDRRYSVDCSKLRALGWEPSYTFENAIAHTFGWYRANGWFWRAK